MGLFVKHANQFNSGWLAEASSGILSGMVVAIETNGTTGEIQLARADRNTHTIDAIAGLAGDDASSTSNTQILVDPVYQVVMSKPARRLGDYLDETVSNRSNWTDSGTAKRGVTVFSIGGEFASDQYIIAASASHATNADASAAHTPAINDGYTVGSSGTVATYIGKLIYGAVGQISIASCFTLARCTGAISNSLLPFRWVFAGA